MTANPTAPAEMPGVEEIGKLLMKSFYDQWFAPGQPAWGGGVYWDFVNGSSAWSPQARAILDLFAPILAEKERLAEDLHYANGVADLAMKHRDAAESSLAEIRKQMLADEGQHREAVAAERERCAKIADELGPTLDGESSWYAANQIAAAIRSQITAPGAAMEAPNGH
ncbi:hypothetical protein ACXIUS_26975 [Bosea thiooxidans]